MYRERLAGRHGPIDEGLNSVLAILNFILMAKGNISKGFKLKSDMIRFTFFLKKIILNAVWKMEGGKIKIMKTTWEDVANQVRDDGG